VASICILLAFDRRDIASTEEMKILIGDIELDNTKGDSSFQYSSLCKIYPIALRLNSYHHFFLTNYVEIKSFS
jgi:hypothetical protein